MGASGQLSETGHGTAVCLAEVINASRMVCERSALGDPCRKKCYPDYFPYSFAQSTDDPMIKIVYGRIYPVLIFVTVLANLAFILVLSQKSMRTATNLILIYIALADVIVGMLPFPFMLIFYALGDVYAREDKSLRTEWCYIAKFTTDGFPPVFHNWAVWLTVLLALQRFVSIRHPVRGGLFWSFRRVNLISLAILMSSVFFCLPKLCDVADFQTLNYEVVSETGKLESFSAHHCIFKPTQLLKSIGPDLYYSSHMWLRVVLFSLVPSLLLSGLSLLLILEIRRSQIRKTRLFQKAQNSHRSPCHGHKTCNTSMLTAIVVIFLIVNLPHGFILGSICVAHLASIQLNHKAIMLASMIDNMLILATSPLNFAIYCNMSSKFRQSLRELVTPARRRYAAMSSIVTVTTDEVSSVRRIKQHVLQLLAPIRVTRSSIRQQEELTQQDTFELQNACTASRIR